ncbi:MAG: efflux RND transporter periplasmic adaptor subunit [Candidatus Eisenbacteria bacterium]
MKATRRIVFVAAIVVVAAVAVFFFLQRRSAKEAQAYRTASVERGDIAVTVTATGTLNPLKTVQVGSQVSGTIAELHADFNSRVRRGQLIALVDTTFLAAAAREAEASVARSQAQVKQAQLELERARILKEKELASKFDYQTALTNSETAIANLKSSEAQLERARVNLKYASIRAPVDGVVVSRNVDVGQTVAASFTTPTLFLIAHDLRQMLLEANVDEADIGMIKEGQRVSFTVNAYPDDVFEGVVSQVRLEPITAQDVVNYTITAEVSNPEQKLLPGMTANISVEIEQKGDVLKVPNMALRFKPPKAPGNGEGSRAPAQAAQPRPQARGEGRLAGEPASGQRNAAGPGRPGQPAVGAREGQPGAGEARPNVRQGQPGPGQARPNAREEQPGPGQARPNAQEGQRGGEAARRQQMVPPRNAKTVWLVGKKGKLTPVAVHTGLTDGSFTEIVSAELKEGDIVAVGLTNQQSQQGQQRGRSMMFQPSFGGRR